MADYTEDQLIGALRKADAAGDTEAARAIARRIQSMRQPAPKADFSGVTTSVDTTARKPGESSLGRDVAMGVRSTIQGAGGLVGAMGLDAANHYLVNPALRAVGLEDQQALPYREEASRFADKLGLPKPETSKERVLGDVGEALTGTGLTMGLGGLLNLGRGAVSTVAPTARNRLAELLTTQPISQVASTAAGAGAAGTTREVGGGTGAQMTAGLLGAMAPGGAGLVTPWVRAQGTIPALAGASTRGVVRGSSGAGVQSAIDDFAAAGTTPSIGQATGNRAANAFETFLGNVPGGAGRMAKFATKQADSAKNSMDDLAGSLTRTGASITPQKAGASIVKGIDGPGGFMEHFRKQSNRLYTELDQQMPPNTRVQAGNASRFLAQQTSPIQGASATSSLLSNPKLSGIRDALEADLASGNGTIPYEALARIRTQVRETISDAGLVSDVPTRQLKLLQSALTEDMKTAVMNSGNPNAIRAFNRANNYYKLGMGRIDAIEHVIDKSGGPEKVYNAAFAGVKDGNTTIRAVMQSLPKEAQRGVTSAFIRRMGRSVSSQQGADGDAFSMSTFLTNWDRVSPEARRTLFDRHGPDFSHNMDKIARMAERVRSGSQVFHNPSGTARLGALITQISGTAATAGTALAMGNVTGAVLAVLGSSASAVSANRLARMMTNPNAVRWLAKNTDMPVGEIIGQLQTLRQTGERIGDEELVEMADALSGDFSQKSTR